MHSTISALNSIRLFKYILAQRCQQQSESVTLKRMLAMFSLTLLAISFTTVTITSPGIVEDIKNREYRIETETDDLGLPEGVGQVIDICLQFGDNILITNYITRHQSIPSLDFMKSSIFWYLGSQNRSVTRYCGVVFMILDICQASLYSLLFGADGPPLASDEDFSAKLEILSKNQRQVCVTSKLKILS